MAALQCEICGGKLMAKSGGLFECEYCGMQYDKTRIQEMVQEIKGTVKVEGTVQVAGTVKVEGPVTVNRSEDARNCALRGWQILKDRRKSKEAETVLNDALKIDPTCPEAHIGLLFLLYDASNFEELATAVIKSNFDFREQHLYQNAKKYSQGTSLYSQLMAATDKVVDHLHSNDYEDALHLIENKAYASADELLQNLSGYRDADELRKKCAEGIKVGHAGTEEVLRLYWEAFPRKRMLIRSSGLEAIITVDDRVTVSISNGPEEYRRAFEEEVSTWTNVKEICDCSLPGRRNNYTNALIGLTYDGRILAAGSLEDLAEPLSTLCDIAWMKTNGHHLALVDRNGVLTMVPRIDAMFSPGPNEAHMVWRNISYIRFDGKGQFTAYNSKNKWLCSVGQHFCYTEVVTDPSKYEQEDTRTPTKKLEFKTLTFPSNINDKVEYRNVVDSIRRVDDFWAITKDGDVFCKNTEYPLCLSLGAISIFYFDKEYQYGDPHCYLLLKDGSFVECKTYFNDHHNWIVDCREVPNLRLFESADDLRTAIARRKQTVKDLQAEQVALKKELDGLKGLFVGKRRKEIAARLLKIESELKGLK